MTPPQFSEDIYETSVNETNIMEGYPLPVDGFLVVECSQENITYSISTPDTAGPFAINSSTGSLFATQSVDYEDATYYQFEVSCVSRDDASLNDSAMVIITVEPVNEFQPVVTRTPSPFFINELTPPGTVLVSTIPGGIRQYTVTDQDSGPDGVITYTIQSVSPPEFASYFELNRTVGALILNQSFDLDEVQVSLVAVRITACDIDPPVVDCPNFVITILPSLVNDNPPIFSQDIYVETVPESFAVNGVIATVSCSDADHSIGAFSGYVISSCLLYTSPSPRDATLSRMPSSA